MTEMLKITQIYAHTHTRTNTHAQAHTNSYNSLMLSYTIPKKQQLAYIQLVIDCWFELRDIEGL